MAVSPDAEKTSWLPGGTGWRLQSRMQTVVRGRIFLSRRIKVLVIGQYTHTLAPRQPCGVVLFDVRLHLRPDCQVGAHPVHVAPVAVQGHRERDDWVSNRTGF